MVVYRLSRNFAGTHGWSLKKYNAGEDQGPRPSHFLPSDITPIRVFDCRLRPAVLECNALQGSMSKFVLELRLYPKLMKER
jgi:hypothetical protein